MKNQLKNLAGIEYAGQAGVTQECLDAIMRLIQYGDLIKKARIISASGEHGFLLTINSGGYRCYKIWFCNWI